MEHEKLTIFTVAATKSDRTCAVIAAWYVIANAAVLTGRCNHSNSVAVVVVVQCVSKEVPSFKLSVT